MQKVELKKFHFKNFRPFGQWQTLKLAKLNFLIGPNNSGKSSVLEVIRLCQSLPDHLSLSWENERTNSFNNIAFDKSKPLELKFELTYNQKITSTSDGRGILGFVLSEAVNVHLKFSETEQYYERTEWDIRLCYAHIEDPKTKEMILEYREGDIIKFGWVSFYKSFLDRYHSEQSEFVLSNLSNSSDQRIRSGGGDFFSGTNGENLDICHKLLDRFSNYRREYAFMAYSRKLGIRVNHISFSYFFKPDGNEYILKSVFDERPTYNEHFIEGKEFADFISNIKLPDGRKYEFDENRFKEYMVFYFSNLHYLFNDLRTIFPKNILLPNERLNPKSVYNRSELQEYSHIFSDIPHYQDEDEINKWLKEFGIGTKLIQKDLVDGVIQLLIERSGTQIPIHLMGYGTFQLLLILTARLLPIYTRTARNEWKNDFRNSIEKIKSYLGNTKYSAIPGGIKSLIILQEPETNLHPKLQSKIADLLVDSVKKIHGSFLIETHSEYIIRKLQFLISRKEITAAEVSLNYFDEISVTDTEGHIREIGIRDDGLLLAEFGPGFFDESARWTFELFKTPSEN